jgi:hypothetical protein
MSGLKPPTYKDKGKKKQVPHFVWDDSLGAGPQGLKPVLLRGAARLEVVPSRTARAAGKHVFPHQGANVVRSVGPFSGRELGFVLRRVVGVGGDVDVAGGLELAGFLVEVYGVGVHDHGASVADGDAFFV